MRLFTGIELPAAWREALDRGTAGLRRAGVRANFTRRDNYHLTLVFLGETGRAEEAAAALDRVEAPSFLLRSAAPGCFAGRGGDIWWLGVEPLPGLMAVQAQLEAALRNAGFSPETRPYRPHITLARRVRSPAGPEPLLVPGLFPTLEAQASKLTLFSSERVDGVLRYLPVYRRTLM